MLIESVNALGSQEGWLSLYINEIAPLYAHPDADITDKLLDKTRQAATATVINTIILRNDQYRNIQTKYQSTPKPDFVKTFSLDDGSRFAEALTNKRIRFHHIQSNNDSLYQYNEITIQTEILIPLIYENIAFGLVILGYTEAQDPSPQKTQQLEALGNILALLIKNSQFQKMAEEMGNTIFSDEKLDSIYARLASVASAIAETDFVRVRIIKQNESHEEQLELQHSLDVQDNSMELDRLIPKSPASVSWRIVEKERKRLQKEKEKSLLQKEQSEKSKNVLIDDPTHYIRDLDNTQEEYLFAEKLKKQHIKSILTVPIIVNFDVLGILNVYSRWPNSFYQKQRYLLMALARSAGEAIARHERHQEQRKRFHKQQALADLINNISRETSASGVFKTAVNDFISFFGFDYAAIYPVDKFSGKIKREHFLDSDNRLYPGIIDEETPYNPDLNDILNHVMFSKKTLHLTGNKIQGAPEENASWIKHNPQIENLVSYFLPVIVRKKLKNNPGTPQEAHTQDSISNSDIPLGVIEVGYRSLSKHISADLRVDMSLYTDNLAEPYYKNTNRKLKQELAEFIESEFRANDNEKQFLENILKYITNKVYVDRSDIGFIGFFRKNDWYPADCITYNIDKEKLQELRKNSRTTGKKGIYRHTLEHDLPYYITTEPVEKDIYYIEGLDNVRSQLSVILKDKKETIGTASFYSPHPGTFTGFHGEWLRKCLITIMQRYKSKKAISAISRLINPFDIETNIDSIYSAIIKHMTEYFGDCFAGVWEKSVTGKPAHYEYRGSTALLDKKLEDYQKLKDEGKIKNDKFPSYDAEDLEDYTSEIEIIQLKQLDAKSYAFFNFAQKYNFTTLIITPIRREDTIGYIGIYSKREVKSLSIEDTAFLKTLADKAAISIQNSKLTTGLLDTPEFFIQGDFKSALQKITEVAKEIVKANPVLLYHYDDVSHRFNKIYYAGDFINKEFKDRLESEEPDQDQKMARKIIQDEEDFWAGTTEDYTKYRNGFVYSNPRFEKEFWHREKIESCAAIKLTKDKKIYGLMFFNFRTPKKFDENSLTRRLIETFSSLAARALENAGILDIKTEIISKNINMVLPIMEGIVSSGLVHNTGHVVFELPHGLEKLHDTFNKTQGVDPKILKEFNEQLNRINQRINQLNTDYMKLRLFHERGNDEQKEIITVHQIVHESYSLIEDKMKKKRIKHTIDLTAIPDNVQIECSVNLIKHVLLNLYVNAWDAMRTGDKLRISAAFHDKSREYIYIRVHDTGTGIDENDKGKIFEAHWTSKKDGNGLGLPISQYIIEQRHSGKIEFRSEKNKYTQFDVILKRHN